MKAALQVSGVVSAVLSLVVAGCGDLGSAGADGEAWTLVVVDTLRFEEDERAFNVFPSVRPDPRGGYLVADAGEAQLRRYDGSGRLLWHFGRRGDGPGEFRRPYVLFREPGGSLLALDHDGRMTWLDSAGTEVTRTLTLPLRRTESAALLESGRLLVSGIPSGDVEGARLHLLDRKAEAIERSFFHPLRRATNPQIAVTADYVALAVAGDTVLAAFGPLDTLYVFTPPDYDDPHAVPFPTERFRVAEPIDPTDFGNPERRDAWLGSFETLAGVFYVGDGTVYVVYRTLRPGEDPEHHLLAMTLDGERLFETAGIGRLTTVQNDLLHLAAPWAETPNTFVRVRRALGVER